MSTFFSRWSFPAFPVGAQADHWSPRRRVVCGLLVPARLGCPRAAAAEVLSIACACPRLLRLYPSPRRQRLRHPSRRAGRLVPGLAGAARTAAVSGSRCLLLLMLLMTSSRKHSTVLISEGSKISEIFFLLSGFPLCCRKKR